jgi:hypothetical protein
MKTGMLRMLNTRSIHNKRMTGSGESGRAVFVALFLGVAQASVVIQTVLKEVFWNAVQSWEAPLLFRLNLGAKKSN